MYGDEAYMTILLLVFSRGKTLTGQHVIWYIEKCAQVRG